MFFLLLLAALGLWVALLVTLAATSPGRGPADTSASPTVHGFFTRV